MAREEIALRMEDVVFRYQENGKRNILDHVTLDVMAGTLTVLMGGSGCGKSTLAAVAAGLYPENGGCLLSGEIRLFGRPLGELDQQQRASYLSVMFQNADLQFCMDTLRRELRFCMENLCVPPREMDERLRRAAETMGAAELLDRKLYTLSGGEKQRAALTCLYVLGSRCVVLDECFANIDPDAVRSLLPMLRAMKREGRTVVAIDHRADLWLDDADEIILLKSGAQTAARGVTRANLPQYRAMFGELGLVYPGSCPREAAPLPRGESALTFRGVCIRAGAAQRRGRRDGPEPPLLLEHADAEFPRGCMTAVLGASGSGKTTAFLAALGRHPYTGTIEINGADLRTIRRKALCRQVGIVFQNPGNQFITQNVTEEIRASLRIWNGGLDDAQLAQRTQALLDGFQLGGCRRYSPYMLSQGQQRRLAVLSVLCGGQKLLLLDEPTYGQDERSAMAILRQLRQKVEREGLTVVFITHDRALAAAWADKLYLLRDRRFAELSPEEALT